MAGGLQKKKRDATGPKEAKTPKGKQLPGKKKKRAYK